MKTICFKQIITAGLCFVSALPLLAQAQENPNNWVIAQSDKIDADHIWKASALYANEAKHKPSVCALDYQLVPETQQKTHPFVFLVSRMSRELWTTDRAWQLTGREDAKLTLKIDREKHLFALDPENKHIFMTLVTDREIDTILGELEKAKTAVLSLAAKKNSKEVSLPLNGLSPVLDSFRQCISAPEIAYGKKPSVINDAKLPKIFKE